MIKHIVRFFIITAMCLPLAWSSDTPLTGEELEKARHALTKVKAILETAQAREEDFSKVVKSFSGAFGGTFTDPKNAPKDNLELVSPSWSNLYNEIYTIKRKEVDIRYQGINTRNSSYNSINRLHALHEVEEKCKQIIFKKINTCLEAFCNMSENSQNGLGVVISLFDRLLINEDNYISHEILESLHGNLLCGYLFALNDITNSVLDKESLNKSVSLRSHDLNTYYSQDVRFTQLGQVYYMQDYLRALSVFQKLGLRQTHPCWAYAEKAKDYFNGTITLEDPSLLMLDSFLFRKALDKASMLSCLEKNIEIELAKKGNTLMIHTENINPARLTVSETKAAKAAFSAQYMAYQKRVQTYITSLSCSDMAKIEKSRRFLLTSIGETSAFSTPARPLEDLNTIVADITSTNETPSKTKGNQGKGKGKAKGKGKRKAAPQRKSPTSTQKIQTTPMLPTVSLMEEHPQVPAPEQAIPQRTRTLSQERILAHMHRGTYGPHMPLQADEAGPRAHMNTKSAGVLRALLDPTTRPFTISYQEALNAMAHIGICEKTSTKKGDYRKLIRKGPNDEQVLGKIFAYRPATSTLGHELMKIYRQFIQQQMEDRPELATLISS